jgi:hypothetical protein
MSITTMPAFGIAQRAQLLRTPQGNILWDCISLIDRATIEMIKAMGGLKSIAISHPHYYSCMVEWSQAFGGIPIHLHAADRKWIMRDDPAIALWQGETKELLPGVTLIRAGGHYPGGVVLHWAAGAGGKGALLSGDIVQVVQDNKSVSFMWSFPNFIPLSAPRVEGVMKTLKPYKFDRVHGVYRPHHLVDGKGGRALGRALPQDHPRRRLRIAVKPCDCRAGSFSSRGRGRRAAMPLGIARRKPTEPADPADPRFCRRRLG